MHVRQADLRRSDNSTSTFWLGSSEWNVLVAMKLAASATAMSCIRASYEPSVVQCVGDGLVMGHARIGILICREDHATWPPHDWCSAELNLTSVVWSDYSSYINENPWGE